MGAWSEAQMLGGWLGLLTVQVTHSIHKSFLWEIYTPSSFRVSVNIICCVCKYESESVRCTVVSDSLQFHGL